MGKRYTPKQILAVAIVSSGVLIVTLSRPQANPRPTAQTPATNHTIPTAPVAGGGGIADASRYTVGIAMLVTSLICTAVHGALQERTYSKYGPCWREGVFYTHMLSLPMFAFMPRSVRRGFVGLSRPKSQWQGHGSALTISSSIHPYTILAINMLTQLICVSGVNQLSSRISAVSTQVVLTARKAISLCFSVWWFGTGWNAQLAGGAVMVFVGSFWYSVLPAAVARGSAPDSKREKRS